MSLLISPPGLDASDIPSSIASDIDSPLNDASFYDRHSARCRRLARVSKSDVEQE